MSTPPSLPRVPTFRVTPLLLHLAPDLRIPVGRRVLRLRCMPYETSNQDWAGFKLRVLTQNLWGLPVISQCLEARVYAFSKMMGG